jgi:putative holliday junction resolvase
MAFHGRSRTVSDPPQPGLRSTAGRPRCYSRVVRLIGIDLGERRIGVAISDASGTLARPLKTIERGPSDADAVERLNTLVAELAAEDGVASVVVGVPTRLDGSAGPQTVRTKAIVALLSVRLTIPVVTQDERLSSREAEERLSVREKDWRKRKAKLDAAAAAVILQDYLDGRARSLSETEPEAAALGQDNEEDD